MSSSEHNWVHVETAQRVWRIEDKYSDYECSQCKTKFRHRYGIVDCIVEAMEAENITETCTGETNEKV